MDNSAYAVVDHLFRHSSGKMVAVLIGRFGIAHIDKIEDIVQETLYQALQTWPFKGLPDKPEAWLHTVANRKAIDLLRHEKLECDQLQNLKDNETMGQEIETFLDHEVSDQSLRLIFMCCHPKLPVESQIMLSLKTLGGLSVAEIASAFISNKETVKKRLTRAKNSLQQSNINLTMPEGQELFNRLDAVLNSIYLLYNEGYKSYKHQLHIRKELCAEAIRLGQLISEHPLTSCPKVDALIALMCLQSARFPARESAEGGVHLLEEQDRRLWYKPLNDMGLHYLSKSAIGNKTSRFHIEASIAATHNAAPSFEQTDWSIIASLYDRLCEAYESPTIIMNRCIALGFSDSPDAAIRGLSALDESGTLNQHYLLKASIAYFYGRLGNLRLAKQYYQKALALCPNDIERNLVQRQMKRFKC